MATGKVYIIWEGGLFRKEQLRVGISRIYRIRPIARVTELNPMNAKRT